MAIFEEVTLNWGGKDYRIEPSRVMGAIAKVEEVITLKELGEFAMKGDAPMARLAMAFGNVLRYAGAKIGDDEVYAGLFDPEQGGSVMSSISVLLSMMVPPTTMRSPGKNQAVPTGGKSSSKRHTKQP